jgi:glycosyltransferase involved in cell wall biosynthesis
MGAHCCVYVTPDLATLATPGPLPQRSAKVPGRARFAHLSRIVPQKNLLFALSLLPDLRGEVLLDIYGPREDDSYWEKCQRAMETLPPHARVAYRGSVPHAEVPRVFAEYDFFVFPTMGESFGHVALEALAQGCPVVLSDQTPWRNLEQQKVGWDLPLDRRQDWVRTLQHCVDMGPEEFEALSTSARQFTSDWLASSKPVEQTHGLLKFAMESGAARLH